MMEVTVLDVGHGLCVRTVSVGGSLVYDCGTISNSPNTFTKPPAYDQLSSELHNFRWPTTAIAISHLHLDHYNGFLSGPLQGVSEDAKLLLSRLPEIDGSIDISAQFLTYLFAVNWLNSSSELDELDLVKQIREQHAPLLQLVRLSQGEGVVAGGSRWICLWPPRSLKSSTQNVQPLLDAIAMFDSYIEQHPESDIRERIRQVEATDTFRELTAPDDEVPDDEVPDDEVPDDEVPDDEVHRDAGAGDEAPNEASDAPHIGIADVNRKFREAANLLSLILASENNEVILFGDATITAVQSATQALGNDSHEFGVVVTPHHGAKGHHPAYLKIRAKLWVSSADGKNKRVVDRSYAKYGGHHHVTETDGSIRATIYGNEVLNEAFCLRGLWWTWPYHHLRHNEWPPINLFW